MREEVEKLHEQNGNAARTGATAQQDHRGNSQHPNRNNHSDEPSWMGEGSNGETTPRDSRSSSDKLQLQSSRASLDAEDRQKFGLLEVTRRVYCVSLHCLSIETHIRHFASCFLTGPE